MQCTFSSKVFVGNKNRNLALRILLFVIFVIIILCILIKLIVGDFHFSDVTSIVISIIVLITCRSNSKPIPQYASTIGTVDFGSDGMSITYADIDGGKSIGSFTETIDIQYADIESIQFRQQLFCYRIIAKCVKKRYFNDSQREAILENGEKIADIYIYVLDEEESAEFRKNLSKYTSSIVGIIDAGEEDEDN